MGEEDLSSASELILDENSDSSKEARVSSEERDDGL